MSVAVPFICCNALRRRVPAALLLCKYSHNNNAAGRRLRNALQQIKVTATYIRKEVTEIKSTAK
jgi:hypothetical protein